MAIVSDVRCWVAVASAAHVRRGRAEGFMQVCHGKAAPLKRIHPSSIVAYYSPTTMMGGKDGLQSFTAIGHVAEGAAYQADMGNGFLPFRRNVVWWPAQEISIKPLLPQLSFSRDNLKTWGYQLRFGLFEITLPDMRLIAEAMSAQPPADFTALRA